ncbi:hypothetical protein SAMN05216249_11116 [Acetitomaculum ruminis DSM 5522]|uniref:Cytokinin riboside 5'-monophosphate phosphoribohydrolase n=1 Tax=Acetitomaculum ruminis DSM 5522 TaxID=1120918 RepID=A0A1I0YQM5_9FIRM|nr:TIGR00730 family Rossman fold protein [Acetitomaculum ruminis]SFB15685.1 hypothetical protein SAMN05216249_11116 [Acetitomaculum ruminis DSM 5522]
MNIAVYCGSSIGKRKYYKDAAIKVGKWIGKNENTLVYGGGASGIMGVVSDTVLENGGKVIGVIPKFITKVEPVNTNLTELHMVERMSERKEMMIKLSDAFIALPGGAGTLEEVTEVITLNRLGRIHSPVIFYDENEYYQPIKEMYQRAVLEEFLNPADMNIMCFTTDFDEIEYTINNFNNIYNSPLM